jgi:hypothetical protein
MMSKNMMILTIVVLLAAVTVIPAFAHNAGPCNDSGEPGNSDYAIHHIKALATIGGIGGDGHVPGSHQGFSFCNPSEG